MVWSLSHFPRYYVGGGLSDFNREGAVFSLQILGFRDPADSFQTRDRKRPIMKHGDRSPNPAN